MSVGVLNFVVKFCSQNKVSLQNFNKIGMELSQIKKHLSFRTRFWAWLLFFFQKIKKGERDSAVIYFSGQFLKICGLKWQDGAISVSFLKTIKLPEALYDFRTASILDGKKIRDLLKAEKGGLSRKLAAKKSVIILPQECVFSKLVGVGSENEAEIKEAVGQIVFGQEGEAARWRRILPIDGKDMDHLDVYFEAIDGNSAKLFYECALKGLGLIPVLFLSEAEAVVSYFFPSCESKDANLIIKVDENRVLFIIFAGRAIQFTATDFIGAKDFEKNKEDIAVFVEKTNNIVDFYKNQILHEHGASSLINRIILLCPFELKDLLADRLALNVKLKIELAGIDKTVEFPKDIDENEKIKLIAALGAIKILESSK